MIDQYLMKITRRDYLKIAAASVCGTAVATEDNPRVSCPAKPKSVAAVVTVYQPGSHADVILGKILEGWKKDGGAGPELNLASMYVEQHPDDDLSCAMSKKHRVPIFDSIEGAVTVGSNCIPVDGVISIAEHGNYPHNELGQHLYPRRRFFEEITNTFQKYNRVVPVFSDKHLGPVWSDAKWMYDEARKLQIPFMAGSSLPVSYRKPHITVHIGCEIEAAVGIGYDGLDIYGSHALDCFQCLVERRRGAETGVKWVQYFEGNAVRKALSDGTVPESVFKAAQAVVPKATIKISPSLAPQEALFLFQYEDGLLGAQFMLQSVNRTAVALKIKNQMQPIATQFEERAEPHHPHFAYLLKAIERMMHTKRPSYPVERTLLTSGILDRAINSRAKKGKRIFTPELSIQYQPIDYPYAPNPNLNSNPVG